MIKEIGFSHHSFGFRTDRSRPFFRKVRSADVMDEAFMDSPSYDETMWCAGWFYYVYTKSKLPPLRPYI